MIAGPAVVDEILIGVVKAPPPIGEDWPLSVPRLVVNKTVPVETGPAASAQETVTFCVVLTGIETGGVLVAGAVMLNFWLLTEICAVPDVPCHVPVIVSVPLFAAVTVNVAAPVASVVAVGALSVLPRAEANVTV